MMARAAKLEAARDRGQGVLHGVDRDRHDRGPVAFRPEQVERDRHRMVDQHFLTHRDVEAVVHQFVDQVP